MGKCFAFAAAVACLSTAVAPGQAMAQSDLAPDPTAELRRQLDEVLGREVEAKQRIVALERRLEALEASTGLAHQALSDEQGAQVRGRGAATAFTTQALSDGTVAIVAQTTGEAAAASLENQAQGEEDEDRKTPTPPESVEIVTEDQQGIYGDRLSAEFGLTYTHFDNAALNLSGFLALDAIFLGRISLDQIVSDVVVADVTLRYGITDRLQFDVNVPYLFRHSNFSSGGAGGDASGLAEVDVTEHGIGDVNFGVSYRLFRETLSRPDVVLNARLKTPSGKHPWGVELVEVQGTLGNLMVPARLSTGSGVWGASAGVSVLKTVDPMVVFGSVTYYYYFREHFNDLEEANFDQPGDVKIGGGIQFGAGVAYALNDRSSLSMSFTERFIKHTALYRDCAGCGKSVIVSSQANVGIVNLGANFSLSERLALITTLGFGVTQDAPDMLLSVRMPYRF